MTERQLRKRVRDFLMLNLELAKTGDWISKYGAADTAFMLALILDDKTSEAKATMLKKEAFSEITK